MAELASGNKRSVCEQCASCFVSGANCVSCEGLCGRSFHIECVNFTLEELIRYRKKSDLWWICGQCIQEIREIRHQRLSREANENAAEVSNTENTSAVAVGIDHGAEIAELKKQIALIQETLADSTITRSGVDSNANSSDGCRPIAHSSPISSQKLLCGTKKVNCANSITDTVDYFWLYFTKIRNSVTESEVMKMIADCLGPNVSTVVKKLLPAWKDPSTMSYISFKVGVEVRLKPVALLPSTWPSGICFREFHNRI